MPTPIYPEHVNEFIESGYREVDMQFNIGRIEGSPRRGFDLIHPLPQEYQRVLWVPESSQEAENLITKGLGASALFECIERNGGVTYNVPIGTRLLSKTLKAAPYHEGYMRSLRERADSLLNSLKVIDVNRFGIGIGELALVHNGGDDIDDVYIKATPPLETPSENPTQSVSGQYRNPLTSKRHPYDPSKRI